MVAVSLKKFNFQRFSYGGISRIKIYINKRFLKMSRLFKGSNLHESYLFAGEMTKKNAHSWMSMCPIL